MGDKWAFVKGTVKIIDERIAYPINHVDIECRRDRGTCEYRQIALMLPDENSFAQSYHVAEIADATYRITRWEENQIDAVPLDNRACRTTSLASTLRQPSSSRSPATTRRETAKLRWV